MRCFAISFGAIVSIVLGLPTIAIAKPVHLKALAEAIGPDFAKSINDCRTCHLPAMPGDDAEAERPHNAFGERLVAVLKSLRQAKLPDEIADRLNKIADEDADRDGASNIVELLLGHSPGDATDRPTPTELATTGKKLAAYQEHQRAYKWRPLEPVVRPAVPVVADARWNRNPIDAFIAADHARQKLTPRPEADRSILLRRIYLDLIGIPPTPAERAAFLADTSPDAYEKVVDRLLASPQYGERWGRHWMDVWRYADWAGFGAEVRDSQPHVWRWRDWIVESLNSDKGYDRMIQEMLAADELAPTDESALRATGFLVRNWFKFNRQIWLDRAVEHTGKAFLGLTLNCARCHDHFYDPLKQHDYYAFRAIFEPHEIRVDRVPGSPDTAQNGLVRVYDAHAATPTYLFVRGEDANPDKQHAIAPAVPPAVLGTPFTVTPINLPPSAISPDGRAFVTREMQATLENAVAQMGKPLIAARMKRAQVMLAVSHPTRTMSLEAARDHLALIEAQYEQAVAKLDAFMAVVATESLKSGTPEWTVAAKAAHLAQKQLALADAKVTLTTLNRSRWTSLPPKEIADRPAKIIAAQKVVTTAEAALQMPGTTTFTARPIPNYPATSTGRRLALARWISDGKNPLTARVAMNHLWLRHFGNPIVASMFDFGKNGQPPTHPALLDWLASEFVARNFSMKSMHRLMVTSQAYRMDSSPTVEMAKIDPDNRWLWRMNSRRMESEIVRDSVLAIAGSLDRTMGGVELDHNAGLTIPRRSLYFRHAPEKHVEFLSLFDGANEAECYRRSDSIVPQQALALANASLVQAQSRVLASKLTATVGTSASPDVNARFIHGAFEQVLSRDPTEAELGLCQKFLTEQTLRLSDRPKLTPIAGVGAATVPAATEPHLRAREGLIHVLINHHEFVMIR